MELMSFPTDALIFTNLDNCSTSSSSSSRTTDIFESYPPSLLYFGAFCCVLFITLGVPGNAITVLALGRSKRLRNATAAFIINLSLADLFFCAFNLPLAVSNFLNRGWVHGEFLCELFPFLRYGNVACGLLTIMAITLNRFVMIAHPKAYPQIFRPQTIAGMIFAIWLVSFGPLLPTWVGWWGRFGFDGRVGTCTIIAVNGRSPKSFLFVLAFILPCFIIILSYLRILCVVWESQSKARSHSTSGTGSGQGHYPNREGQQPDQRHWQDRSTPLRLFGNLTNPLTHGQPRDRPQVKKRGAGGVAAGGGSDPRDMRLLKMVVVIFVAFILCYLPLTIVKVLGKEEEMPVLNIFSYIAMYLTSCTNPIIYVVMSREYRRAYVELFTCGADRGHSSGDSRRDRSEGSRSYEISAGRM